jgi:hypothetical protein
MSNLTLRRSAADTLPSSLVEVLKDLFRATPLALVIALFKR